MLTDNRADYRTQDWFLIACEGDLVLKLAQDLLIGEDERGQTVLSPARENALLRVTSEHGCLTLQAMAMDWTFSEDGGLSRQHLTFVEGLTLKLSFPTSSLILSPDFQAGPSTKVDREIRLLPTETPALTLTRVDEPVILIEPALLPAPEAANADQLNADQLFELEIEEAAAQLKATEALTRWDHQIPDEEESPHPAAAVRPEVREPQALTPEAPQPHVPESTDQEAATSALFEELPTRAPGLRRRTHRPLAGLIAATALLTPMYLFLVDGHKLGIDFPLTNYRPLDESVQVSGTIERVPQPAINTVSSDVPTTDAASEADSVLPVQPSVPIQREPEAPVANEQQHLLIASLLAEAKAFYDAGLIVTPIEANAVSHLTQVLSMDPTNEKGLRLMYLSAVTLIEEAQAAHEAGDNYLARNLVEEVLGFHPEFDDARALLDSWSRTPEG